MKQLKIGKEIGLLKWVAFDDKFTPNKSDKTFKHWAEQGITAVCTTIKKGVIKSFQDLKNENDLTNKDLFRYLQLRDYYIKNIKTNEDKIDPVIKLLVKAYSQHIPKAVSALYSCLMESTLYVKSKWERELGENIPE